MAIEDYATPEVGITAAITALLVSPRAKRYLRQSSVYVLSQVIKLKDGVVHLIHANPSPSGTQPREEDSAE